MEKVQKYNERKLFIKSSYCFRINTLDNKNENFYNSFIIVDRNLNKKFQYNKIKLVPFGEFLPFEYMLKKIGFKKITEGYGSFSKGNVSNTFFIRKHKYCSFDML